MTPEESASPPLSSATTPRERSTLVVWVVLAMIGVGLLLLVWRAQGRGQRDAARHPVVGQRLAFAQLDPLTGDAAPISAEQLQGKVTLLNFWGPWCDYCLLEMPHLVRMRQSFADRNDVQFLFVSCGPDWEADAPPDRRWSEELPQLRTSTAAILTQHGYDIPTHSDPRGNTRQSLADIDAWDGYPTTLLLDREGVIRYVAIGYTSGDEYAIEGQLRKLLDLPPGGERGT